MLGPVTPAELLEPHLQQARGCLELASVRQKGRGALLSFNHNREYAGALDADDSYALPAQCASQ